MPDIVGCGIECPLDWVLLPDNPGEDLTAWARRTAEELGERNRVAGHDLDQRVLRDDLRDRAEDSRSRDPLYAFACYPDGFDTALALLEVDVIHPDATVPHITLDWLAETFSAGDFGPPELQRTELPIGPGVRIRQNFAVAPASRRRPGVLMETITYGTLPKSAKSAIVLLMSWTVPGIAEEMKEAAESIAHTLSVEVAA